MIFQRLQPEAVLTPPPMRPYGERASGSRFPKHLRSLAEKNPQGKQVDLDAIWWGNESWRGCQRGENEAAGSYCLHLQRLSGITFGARERLCPPEVNKVSCPLVTFRKA